MQNRGAKIYRVACFLGAVAVVILAMAAHALKSRLDPDQLNAVKTGAQIQLLHAILLVALTINVNDAAFTKIRMALTLVVAGIFCFSFSIYLLTAKDFLHLPFLRFLWPVTPIGGTLLIAAWLFLLRAMRKN